MLLLFCTVPITLCPLTNYHFFCSSCKPILSTLQKLPDKLETIEKRLSQLESSQIFSDEINEKQHHNTQNNNFSTDIQQTIRDAIEVEVKKPNAVLFGLPETEHDLNAVRALFQNQPSTDYKFYDDDILKVFRDGPQMKSLDGKQLPRLLKVCCTSSAIKDRFIDFIKHLRADPQFRHLRARPDLTFNQRQHGRALLSKLIDLEQSTGTQNNYYIDYAHECIKDKNTKNIIFKLSSNNQFK